jgi:predicted RNase H-like HicB family nuclease
MRLPTIVDAYAREAVRFATLEQLESGKVVGRVPQLPGVIAFGDAPAEAAVELYLVIEDWAKLRIQEGRHIPVLGEIDLNTEENRKLVANHS